jgi:hypothetical protein
MKRLLRLFFMLICIASLANGLGVEQAFAISQDDYNSIITNTPFYDPNAADCGGSNGSTSTVSQTSSATASDTDIKFMAAWAEDESGGGGGDYNPLNFTGGTGTNYNSVGVKNYATYTDGITYTTQFLNQTNVAGIIAGLKANDSNAAAQALSTFYTWDPTMGSTILQTMTSVNVAASIPTLHGTTLKVWATDVLTALQIGTSSSTPTPITPTTTSSCSCEGSDTSTSTPASDPSSGGSTTFPATGNNPQVAYQYFLSKGYNATEAAGIVGNLDYESTGVNPTQEQGGGGGGYGIAQFTGTTLSAMIAWVTADNENPDSLQGQLDYISFVLGSAPAVNASGTEEAAIKAASDTVNDATLAFENQYERPQFPTQSISTRDSDANGIYAAYSGLGPADNNTSTAACSTPPSTTSPDCTSATGNAVILCQAELYNGIFYQWGGGHSGYPAFRAACPLSTLSSAAAASSVGEPGPCSTDCSGLVSMAVDAAFNQQFDWDVGAIETSPDWSQISITSVEPGDVVTVGTDTHVEIVDHYDSSTGTLYTFGSHYTGVQTSAVTSTPSAWTGAYKYIGPT